MQDGFFFSRNSSSLERKSTTEEDAPPLNSVETFNRIHEGRNNFFTAILIVLPISALLWGMMFWVGKRILF
jgi:hypothetical protein